MKIKPVEEDKQLGGGCGGCRRAVREALYILGNSNVSRSTCTRECFSCNRTIKLEIVNTTGGRDISDLK